VTRVEVCDVGVAVATFIEATERNATVAPDARTLLIVAELTMRLVRLPLILVTAAALIVAAFSVLASGCRDSGDSGESKFVVAAADVRKAFEHQRLNLADYDVRSGVPALGYPVGAEGTQAMRISCLILDLPAIARVYVQAIRSERHPNVSRALRAKNVAVVIDPAATPDEIQRTLRAVVELRHE